MIYFFNEKVELEDTSDALVLTQKRELNGLITAYAEIKYKKEYENYSYIGLKKNNNFYIHRIRKRVKRDKILILKGLHIFFYDLKGSVVEDIRPKNETAEVAFTRILLNTNWELIPTKAGIRSTKNFYNVSALEAFNEALNVWDVEFEPVIRIQDGKIVKKAVRIVNQLSDDKGKWFEYGDKLLTVEAETSEDDVFTTFIGKGKGIEYFDDDGNSTGGYSRKIEFKNVEWSKSKGDPIDKPKGQNYITLYNPKHSNSDQEQRVTYIEFSNIEDEELLLEKTYQYALQYSRPRVEFSASAIAEEIELGEIVRIIRDDIGIRYKARVFEIEEDFLTNKTMTIKFGDRVTSTISDTIRGTYNEVKSLEELANGRIDKVYEQTNTAIAAANGKNTVFRGPERPIANADGDIWFRILPNDQIRMYVWDEDKNDWISQHIETPDLTEELTEYENRLNEEIDKKLTESENNIKQNIEDNNKLLRQSILDSVNDNIDISNFENEFIEIAKKYNKDFTLGDRNLLLDTTEPRTSGSYPLTKYELSDEGKKLKSGDEVTVTFKVDLNDDEWDVINFYNSGGMVRIGGLPIDELSEEGVGQFTTTWSELEDQEFLNVYYGTWPERDKLTSNTVEWIKLTRGNKASLDHTPAPEDLNNTLIKKYNEIEDNLEIFRQDIGSIEKDLNSGNTFQKINSLEKTAEDTKQTIANIENGLTTEFNKKIENVEGTVTQLGKTVDDNKINLATFENTINGMKSTVSSTKDDLKKVTSRVQTAEKEILKISSIEGDVSKLNTRINTAESSISQISKLSNNLNNISSGGYNLISNGKGDSTEGFEVWGPAKLDSNGERILVRRAASSGYTGLQTTPFKIKQSRKYTIAFDFWSNADINILSYNYIIRSVGSNARIESLKIDNSKIEKRYSITFHAPFDDDKARVMLATTLSQGQELYFKNIMITESTIPSSFGLSEEELIVESTNTIKRTYDSTISSIRDDVNNQNSTITQLSNEISSKVSNDDFVSYRNQEFNRILNVIKSISGQSVIEQTVEGISTLVTKDNISTSIKQSANDIFMYSRDGKKITGFKLGADTAELLGDFKVTGDMIVGGVLNAGDVRIINLDASAITAGTIRGNNGEWNLTLGRFYTGEYADRTELYNGSLTTYANYAKRISVDKDGIRLYHGTGSGVRVGHILASNWKGTTNHLIDFRHERNTSFAFSYEDERNPGNYYPYMIFDQWDTADVLADPYYPIEIRQGVYIRNRLTVHEYANFLGDIRIDDRYKTGTLAMAIQFRKLSFDGGFGLFIGNQGNDNGLGISRWGNIYKVKDSTWSKI